MQKFGATSPAECIGKFAVVRQIGSASEKAKFTALHDTLQTAEAECARLASMSIAQEGQDCNSVFFVLEIKGCMGMRSKKLVSIPSADASDMTAGVLNAKAMSCA